MHNMKTLLSLLTILSLMFISCSASSVESDEDNKIADRPITPKEMQRMMGRGFDVQWAEFSKKIEQLTLFVTNQMQLEAKEPSHGTLASLRNAPEHLVDMYPLVPAHSKGSAVHETYACTFPKQYLLDEQSQRYGNFLFKFHEPVV